MSNRIDKKVTKQIPVTAQISDVAVWEENGEKMKRVPIAAFLDQETTSDTVTPSSGTRTITGSLSTTGKISSTGDTDGVGYSTGAGGSIVQTTSITTTVVLNKICGKILTVSSTLAAGAEATFTVTNSTVAATDVVIANLASTSSAGTPVVFVTAVAAGSFDITLSNLHASNALDNDMVINFAVIKSVVS